MSKSQTLRALVNERLTAAAEEIFALFERTIAEYEEEVCRSKEENQRKQELLDSILSPSKSPGPGLNQDPPHTPRIKEEPQEPQELSVKQYRIVQVSVGVPESSAVCVRTEESSLLQQRQTELRVETQGEDISAETHLYSETEGDTEYSCDMGSDEDWRVPPRCSAAQMETDADGDHNNQVQKGQRLRALVNEIFALFESTIAEYEEEVCHSKEENQRKQELLESTLSPSKSPGPGLNQDPPQTPQIKEEPEELSIKQEEDALLVQDLQCVMAGQRRISVREAIEMVCLPHGALSDTESISDDEIGDPVYESDLDDDEPLAAIARAISNHLDVEIHNVHADSDTELLDDDEPQPGPAPVNKEFSWNQRKPPAADIDSSFQGPAFSPPPDEIPSPKWYFDQFMDKSVFEYISHQSNLYAFMNGTELKTTPSEMEQFIGLHILMTVVRMPSYRLYWQTATRYDPIATVMGRKRFDHLRTYIHMNDNTNVKQKGEPGYDPLFKVRPVLEKVRANCLKVEPEENHSIREQMIPFKGKIGIKRYIKNKPKKCGIKVFTRAGVTGLVYDFEIYTGKGTVTNERGLGVAGEVVLRLVSEVPKGLNYKCYFDNWFTSPELIVELKKMGILTVASINHNRLCGCTLKSDKELSKAGRGAYEVKYEMTSGMVIVKWYDNKAVLLVSSFIGPDPVDRCRRWSKEKKEYVVVDRPHIVKVYNNNMGGADLADMFAALYRIDIRPRRWYLRILFYLIDLSLVNGWLLYRRHLTQKQEKKYMPFLDFRAQVADALIKVGKQADLNCRKRGRSSFEDAPELYQDAPPPPPLQRIIAPWDVVRLDRFDHFPIHADKRGRCRLCKNGYTQTACLKCKVLLCFTKEKNCFLEYHTKK